MSLTERLEKFKRTWLVNPAGRLEFVRLVQDVHDQPSHDHADAALLLWIEIEEASLRRIGAKV